MVTRWPTGAGLPVRGSRVALAVGLGTLVAVILGCGGSGLEWEAEPYAPTWDNQYWLTSYALVAYHREVAELVAAEVEWCETHQLEPPPEEERGDTFAPNADPELIAHVFQPIEGKELEWIRSLSDEVAARRGLTLDPLPAIRAITPDTYRRLSCWYMLHPDPEHEPDAHWEFEQIVGYLQPQWTPGVLNHLGGLTTGGWYDAEEGVSAITLITSLPLPPEIVELVAHELVHAMQDTLLEGGLLDRWEEGSSDYHSAVQWVVEGDATTSELPQDDAFVRALIESRNWGEREPENWELAGVSLAEIGTRGGALYAPYLSGAEYIAQVQAESGWRGVNELLLDPPESSEQIRHPDKLAAREPPLPVEPLVALRNRVLGLADDAELAWDTRGEGALADLMAFATTDAESAAQAADGWGVDVFSLAREYDGQQATIVIWQIAFDNPSEHAEGVGGLREWLLNTSEGEAISSVDRRAAAWDWSRGSVRIVDHARLVWVIASDQRAIADELVPRILDLKQESKWWQAED